MTYATKELQIGAEIVPKTYDITQEKINVYARYVSFGKDGKNIHTDDEVARQAGLPRALAHGRYPIGYLSECMRNFFGQGWVQGGRLDVTLVKGIYPADTITVKGRITGKIPDGNAIRLILDVWLENQHGEKVTLGTASGLVHG